MDNNPSIARIALDTDRIFRIVWRYSFAEQLET